MPVPKLYAEAPELTDVSLLLFADLGATQKRNQQRVNTLVQNLPGSCFERPPQPLLALQAAGWVEIRRGIKTYIVEITDAGLAAHRRLMEALRSAVRAQPTSTTVNGPALQQ